MRNTLVNLMLENHKITDIYKEPPEFLSFGKNILDSEELTDTVYSVYIGMIVERFEFANDMARKAENSVSISDLGMLYKAGPYIPCVRRLSLVQNIDVKTDGVPGIRPVGLIHDDGIDFYLIRPVDKYPRHVVSITRDVKKYKLVLFTKERDDKVMSLDVIYFGLRSNGDIVTPVEKGARHPIYAHLGGAAYPALVANAWADGKYQWIVETREQVGKISNVKLRLGVDKESIKSLFYARSCPLTETGRKRPILHWVRSHQRRLEKGIDVDISAHLRGICEFNMHGVDMAITQPNKDSLKGADPATVKEMFQRLAEEAKK